MNETRDPLLARAMQAAGADLRRQARSLREPHLATVGPPDESLDAAMRTLAEAMRALPDRR